MLVAFIHLGIGKCVPFNLNIFVKKRAQAKCVNQKYMYAIHMNYLFVFFGSPFLYKPWCIDYSNVFTSFEKMLIDNTAPLLGNIHLNQFIIPGMR